MYDNISIVLTGEANLDGRVDFSDFVILSASFGHPSDQSWGQGDFHNDGSVSFADFLGLANNFGQRVDQTVSVPEPTSFALLFAALLTTLRTSRYCRPRRLLICSVTHHPIFHTCWRLARFAS